MRKALRSPARVSATPLLVLLACLATALLPSATPAVGQSRLVVTPASEPVVPTTAIDTLDCSRPLTGNACLLLYCPGGRFSPSPDGNQFSCSLTASDIAAKTGGQFNHCTINDLNVALDLTITPAAYGNFVLSRSGGVQADLFGLGQVCPGPNGTLIDLAFDDESGNPNLCSAAGSTVHPTEALSTFDAAGADGNWLLQIFSSGAFGGQGDLSGYALAMDGSCSFISQPTCTPSGSAACLQGNRFKVSMTYQATGKPVGNGTANLLTPDTGWFWFFSPANAEVMVKVLDGCGTNHRYWVFAAGLTNVRVDITVEDTVTHAKKIYTNPQGTTFKAQLDISAFASCP